MARGNNVYNSTSQAAQSGPGGPEMGRPPTAVPPEALAAVLQRTGTQPPGLTGAAPPGMAQRAQNVPPQAATPTPGVGQANARALGGLAKAALQAAAQRKIKRSR